MENEVLKLLKGVRGLWIELHGEAYYDCNGGQDLDRAIELLESEPVSLKAGKIQEAIKLLKELQTDMSGWCSGWEPKLSEAYAYVVKGTDGQAYYCIEDHTAASASEPVTIELLESNNVRHVLAGIKEIIKGGE